MSPRRLAILAALWLWPATTQAGPWVPGRRHFFLQLRQSALFADQRYDATRGRQPIMLVIDDSGQKEVTSYRQALTTVYGEVGLAQRLALVVEMHLVNAVVQPLRGLPDRTVVGFGDLRLGGKILLFDDEVTGALQVAITAPTGSSTDVIPLGPGDIRTDFGVLIGRAFFRPDLYFSAELFFRLRSAATVADPDMPGKLKSVTYAHEIRYAVQAGYTYRRPRRLLQALGVGLKVEGSYALAAAVEDGLGILNPVAGSYFKLGPELLWSPVRGLQLTLGGHYFIIGRSMPAFAEVAFGIGYLR